MLFDRKPTQVKKNLKRGRDESESIHDTTEPPQKQQKVSPAQEVEQKEKLPPSIDIIQYLQNEKILNIDDLKKRLASKPIENADKNHNHNKPKPILHSKPPANPPKPQSAKQKYQYIPEEHIQSQNSNNHNANNDKK